MGEQGYITRAQANVASRIPFEQSLFTRQATVASYFVEQVRHRLRETYGAYALYNSGLKVYTTLNLKMQRAAEEALVGGLRELDKRSGYRPHPAQAEAARDRIGPYAPRPGEILPGTVLRVKAKSVEVQVGRYRGEISFETLKWTKLANPAEAFKEGGPVLVHVLSVDERKQTVGLALEQHPELEGAFLALDPQDGSIKAMIGGYDIDRSKFNRATQAKRQPGSAFKPFVYATAFDRDYTPSTIIDDSPISFQTVIGGTLVEWSPENFDRKFHGPTTLRRALENSVNVVTVKLLGEVGVDPVIEMAHQVGIASELRREVALALGVSEVTLLELVSAYGVFANGGVRAEPFAVRKVTDRQGRILEQHLIKPQEVMRPETAYVVVNVMKGVIERGTGARARVLRRPLAGKTGTSSDSTDVWFVGFSPSLVAGVWIGYDLKRSLGPAETGARLALPIWINFMQKALAGSEPQDFAAPEGVVAVPVDIQTGRPGLPGASGVITEYFVEGTEPTDTDALNPASPTPQASEAIPPLINASPRPFSSGPVPFTLTPGPAPRIVPLPQGASDRKRP
jgi:penicillin-binding protein 1A